jgi:hypothetical protein
MNKEETLVVFDEVAEFPDDLFNESSDEDIALPANPTDGIVDYREGMTRRDKIEMLIQGLLAAASDCGDAAMEYRVSDSDYREAQSVSFLKHVNVNIGTSEKPKTPSVDHIKALVDQDCKTVRELQRINLARFEASKVYFEAVSKALSAEQSLYNGER